MNLGQLIDAMLVLERGIISPCTAGPIVEGVNATRRVHVCDVLARVRAERAPTMTAQILEIMAKSRTPLRSMDVARKLGIQLTIVHALIAKMVARGELVVVDETRPRSFAIGNNEAAALLAAKRGA